MKKISVLVTSIFLSLIINAQVYKGNTNNISPEEKLNELYCSGFFKTTDGSILEVASNLSVKGYLNILDWLQGRVAGLQVYTSRMGVSIPVIRGSVPGIYVDEMPVPMSYLEMLNVNDIAIVKVIKTPFYGGFNGGGGAIAIYTLGGEKEEEGEESSR